MENQANVKLFKFTASSGSGFPSFKDGFDYLNYETIAEIAGDTKFWANARTLIRELILSDYYYGVESCNFGTTGIIVQSTLLGTKYNFVVKCTDMESCDKNVFYTGICNHDKNCKLERYMSCTKCLD